MKKGGKMPGCLVLHEEVFRQKVLWYVAIYTSVEMYICPPVLLSVYLCQSLYGKSAYLLMSVHFPVHLSAFLSISLLMHRYMIFYYFVCPMSKEADRLRDHYVIVWPV